MTIFFDPGPIDRVMPATNLWRVSAPAVEPSSRRAAEPPRRRAAEPLP
ncbi:MAG TPA: hypothetical protein VGP95_05155 [Gemmatimonadaceae bacterium]|jgi:hypothetical protein|nr:hypothetical protein [Gemmatimonadaceae bacterium]